MPKVDPSILAILTHLGNLEGEYTSSANIHCLALERVIDGVSDPVVVNSVLISLKSISARSSSPEVLRRLHKLEDWLVGRVTSLQD